jgi:hypothetical protein
MRRAIGCCGKLTRVDRDDVPICSLNLKLTPEEREESQRSVHQLMFLQAVYNAQQLRYDPLEYDLLKDSMIRLQEYVGLPADELEALVEDEQEVDVRVVGVRDGDRVLDGALGLVAAVDRRKYEIHVHWQLI